MASSKEVKTYLAYWFQLGKKLVLNNRETILPQPVLSGDRFSPQFEECWQRIISVGGKDCYLEGSNDTIADLLSSNRVINSCARCSMPIAVVDSGITPLDCLCSDLDNWPNDELPAPRSPVNSQSRLGTIAKRLQTNDNPRG